MEKSPLTDSKYRVIAKLFNDKMMEDWILGRTFPVRHDYFAQASAPEKKGVIEKAKDLILQAEKIAGSSFKAPKDAKDRRLLLDQVNGAIGILIEVREKQVSNLENSFLLARAHAILYNLDEPGSFEKTVKYAREAIEFGPEELNPLMFLAAFFSNSGHPDEALELYWSGLWKGEELPNSRVIAQMPLAFLKAGNGLWANKTAAFFLNLNPNLNPDAYKSFMVLGENAAGERVIRAVDIRFDTESVRYQNRELNYAFQIPVKWRLVKFTYDTENNIPQSESGILGLPPVKDEDGSVVENNIALSIIRQSSPEEAERVSKDILASSMSKIGGTTRETPEGFIYESIRGGYLYKGRVEVNVKSDRICILVFSATPATYDNNLVLYDKWKKSLEIYEDAF